MNTSWAAQGLAAVLAEPAVVTREEVFAALVELGGTTPAVAATLDAGQHFGDRGCCHSCPLVNFLWARFPTCARIEVGAVQACIWVDGDHRQQPTFLVDLPDPVLQFRIGFDHGGFHALDAAGVTG